MIGGRRGESALDPTRAIAGGVLALVTLLGALVRLPGIDRSGLYFDDAWFALPARVPFATALKMIVTAPGYTMLQREWIVLGPGGNVWPKVLAFLLGVACIPVMYFVARRLGFGLWLSVAIAGLVAVSPAAIEYSVRVKEYEGDLLFAAVVLVTAEAVRRTPTTRRLVVLGVVSVVAVTMSTSLVVVVVGSWLAVLLEALVVRIATGRVLVAGAVTALVCAVPTLWIAGRIPPRLTAFWRANDHLVGGPFTLHHASLLIAAVPLGLAHGLVGTPVGQSSVLFGHSILGTVASACGLGILLLATFVVVRSCRRDAVPVDRVGVSSLATISFALLLWLVGAVPLGTGRTDLVVYPSIAILGGLAAREVISWLRSSPATMRVAPTLVVGTGVVLALVGAGVAWRSASWYPAQDVSSLPAATSWQAHRNTAVLVTARNSYTWAFEELSSFRVHSSKTDPASSTIGFWVTFDSPRVLEQVASPGRGPSTVIDTRSVVPGLGALPPRVARLWLIAPTASTFSPSSGRLRGPAAERIVPSRAMRILDAAGWRRSTVVERAPGVAAILYRR